MASQRPAQKPCVPQRWNLGSEKAGVLISTTDRLSFEDCVCHAGCLDWALNILRLKRIKSPSRYTFGDSERLNLVKVPLIPKFKIQNPQLDPCCPRETLDDLFPLVCWYSAISIQGVAWEPRLNLHRCVLHVLVDSNTALSSSSRNS
jgi:hypothetical protein